MASSRTCSSLARREAVDAVFVEFVRGRNDGTNEGALDKACPFWFISCARWWYNRLCSSRCAKDRETKSALAAATCMTLSRSSETSPVERVCR